MFVIATYKSGRWVQHCDPCASLRLHALFLSLLQMPTRLLPVSAPSSSSLLPGRHGAKHAAEHLGAPNHPADAAVSVAANRML